MFIKQLMSLQMTYIAQAQLIPVLFMEVGTSEELEKCHTEYGMMSGRTMIFPMVQY
jgi:hypothetical protein